MRICLSTFHSMKGLEFKNVLLVDVNDRTAPKRPAAFDSWGKTQKERHLKAEKSLLYVAISRAIHAIVITGTGRKSGLVEMIQ